MKKSLRRVVGRTAFWLGWPVLYLYLKGSTRTRVLIAADDSILVVRGWLGDGKWELTGGGVHKGEDILAGAVREVREETGITLEPTQLMRGEGFDTNNHKLPFRCEPFFVRLTSKPTTSRQTGEIADIRWMSSLELSEDNMEASSLTIIKKFKQQDLL